MFHSPKNPPGSALMVTMALMGILSLMMILLLEKIIPTSQATRGIENSTVALYHSASSIEKAFASMNYKLPGRAAGTGTLTLSSTQEEGKYSILQQSTIIPVPGKGNSEYDANWNKIYSGNPVQLKIDQSFITGGGLGGLVFDMRMPKLGSNDIKAGDSTTTRYFSSDASYGVVSVTLTNGTTTYSAVYGTGCTTPGAQNNGLTANRINTPDSSTLSYLCVKNITGVGTIGILNTQANIISTVTPFCANGCTLKFSLINKLENAAGKPFPYLEYRIRKGSTNLGTQGDVCFLNYPPNTTCGANLNLFTSLPLPFTTVTAEGVSYGFQRTSSRNLLQLTTSEELDFAVFQ